MKLSEFIEICDGVESFDLYAFNQPVAWDEDADGYPTSYDLLTSDHYKKYLDYRVVRVIPASQNGLILDIVC